jgi:hypothetical protein
LIVGLLTFIQDADYFYEIKLFDDATAGEFPGRSSALVSLPTPEKATASR